MQLEAPSSAEWLPGPLCSAGILCWVGRPSVDHGHTSQQGCKLIRALERWRGVSRAPQTESAALPPPPSCSPRRTLADIIMEKLTEKQTEVETVMSEVSGFPVPQLDPRVLEVYRGVREVRTERRAMTGHPHQGSGGPHLL